MKSFVAALALLVSNLSFAQQLASGCSPAPAPSRTSASASAKAKTAAPLNQEIHITCGSTNVTQTTSESKLGSIDKEVTIRTISIDKLLEAIAKLLSSVAWPIASVLIAYYFKKEIAALLSRLKRFKAAGTEAEFVEYLRETEAEVDIERTPDARSVSPSIIDAAAANPRGTVLSAWLEVEEAVFHLFEVKGLNRPVARPVRGVLPLMREIQKAELLDLNYIALFHDLRSLRNDAAHDREFNPPAEAVVQYIQLARELTTALKKAANGA